MTDEGLRQTKQNQVKNRQTNIQSKPAEAPIKKEEKIDNKSLLEQAKEKIKNRVAGEKEKQERKQVLEREYIIPLRREWIKTPKYKRANKAVKTIKKFLVRHMKIYDRDLRKVKVDVYLNNELRFRGMKKPPAKIRVKAIKYDDDIVEAKLVSLPKHLEFRIAREARKQADRMKREIETPKKIEEEKKEPEKEQDKEEKEKTSKEATQKFEKSQAKQIKHTAGIKKAPIIKRKALQK